MNEATVERLVQEVSDLLDAGEVGLYEFLWILRSDESHVDETEFRLYAAAALRRLQRDGLVRLVWKLWGDVSFERDASDATIDDDSWNDPTEDPYLAVVAAT
jgi:hypothetical protein